VVHSQNAEIEIGEEDPCFHSILWLEQTHGLGPKYC